MNEGDIKKALDKLKEHTPEDNEEPEKKNALIDGEATSLKEHEQRTDEMAYLSVEDWLQRHKYDERTQVNIVNRKLDALQKGEKVLLTDMNRQAREEFTREVAPVLGSLVDGLPVRAKVWLEFYSHENGTEFRPYTKESFLSSEVS